MLQIDLMNFINKFSAIGQDLFAWQSSDHIEPSLQIDLWVGDTMFYSIN